MPGRYLATGVVAFLIFALGVPCLAPELVRTNDDPRIFALTHVAVLGWISMTVFGAVYQLFPVALGGAVRAPRLASWNYWVLVAGLVGFIPSFFFSFTLGVALFGSLTVGGILHFASQMLRSFPSVTEWHPMGLYLVASLVWLVATVGFGFAYALDWWFGWFDITPNLLAAHVELGLAGWLGLTVMGVSYKLTELFALAHGHPRHLAIANLGLWCVALGGLASSLIFVPGTFAVTAFAALLAVSALIHVIDLSWMLHHRRRRPFTLETWHTVASLAALVTAAAIGLDLTTRAEPNPGLLVAYGYCAIAGWLGFAVLGKSYKILSFLFWLQRYGSLAGKEAVPLMRDLVDDRVGYASLVLLALGFLGVLGGLVAQAQLAVEISGSVYLGGALLYAAQTVKLLRPLVLPPKRTPHPATSEVLA